MDDRHILDELAKSAWKDVEYFSNAKKDVRERWVVSKFLSVLGVQHQENEINSLEQHNKADVCFRDALFQVKELTDPNPQRGKYKDIYNSIKGAKHLDEVIWVGDAQDVPPIARMYDLVHEKASELSKKYESWKGELDLLLYVTRTAASLIRQNEIDGNTFPDLGWRSVSCVNEKQAVVLFSSPTAPEFLIERSQKLITSIR